MSYPMSIGEAARAAGLTAKMVRDYEALGLIPPPDRTEAGYRQYTRRDVDTLCFIRRARSMSFSIRQVEQLLSLWSDGQRESRDVKALARAHMAELDRKMAELARIKAALEGIASSCPGDHTGDCPILTTLSASAPPSGWPRESRKPTMPVRGQGRRVPEGREAPSYPNLLASWRKPNAGVTAPHA
jgi:Cu(I)-responsive transcriptional regulator